MPWSARLAPILLAVLALLQLALVAGADLSPWKGGGFGMFSSNDHGSFRSVRVWALAPGGEERLRVPVDLQRLQLHTRELPTRRRMLALAEAMAPEAPQAQALRVEVWRLEFDAALRPEARLLAQAVRDRAP